MSTDESVHSMNKVYTQLYGKLLELAYGDGFMSEGGTTAVDKMIAGVDMNNKFVLDFGSGLGGVAFHLASRHKAIVTGVDINPHFIEESTDNLPKGLENRVQFVLLTERETLPFEDNSFDFVVSRGVMLHLTAEEKQNILKAFYRILKPGGKIIIEDWLSIKDGVWGPTVQKLIETEKLPLFATSPETYRSLISAAGFKNIVMVDRSREFENYNIAVAKNLSDAIIRKKFLAHADQKTLDDHQQGYFDIAAANANRETIDMHIKAIKPIDQTKN